MLKTLHKALNYNYSYFTKKGFSTCTTVREKWDLIAAVCLERKPLITPQLSQLEQQFQKLVIQLEYERSLKSDHELRYEKDVKQQELLKKGDVDVDVSLKETAQDFVDACTEELAQFQFASNITDADKSNDVKSLKRKLDKHLVLLVKQKLGENDMFLLPQSFRQDGETLKQTAQRVLKEICGQELKAQFYGNAPSGFYKYKYPHSIKTDSKAIGAKIFIYIAKYCNGELNKKGLEYKWLDRIELSKELSSKYHNSISHFLIDED